MGWLLTCLGGGGGGGDSRAGSGLTVSRPLPRYLLYVEWSLVAYKFVLFMKLPHELLFMILSMAALLTD